MARCHGAGAARARRGYGLMFARFDNSYARLPEFFHRPVVPMPVRAPELIWLNQPLADELGLQHESMNKAALAEIFSGSRMPEGAAPLAMAYAGHQFGGFVPQLGDGRALLMGEVVDAQGMRRDIHLKGSGPTPFARRGDGRAALGPVLREVILCEAMHALGIPTTRALAATSTGEPVLRETVLPGAVLARVARAHIRVGTFEHVAAAGDIALLKTLADHTIARLYPALAEAENPYAALLKAVIEAQAKLVAQWMGVGFIHGVMNTDNMAISGETIDYGPCAFMEGYDPAAMFSAIDSQGRYAYANQPRIAQWNLARFAETLLPLLDAEMDVAVTKAETLLEQFPTIYGEELLNVFCAKLGLQHRQAEDAELLPQYLALMHQQGADFTLSFRTLCDAAEGNAAPWQALFAGAQSASEWLVHYQRRLAAEHLSPSEIATVMRRVNPLYIPRNHLVRAVTEAAEGRQDLEPLALLQKVLAHPYIEQPGAEIYAKPATTDERVYQTFCGT